MDSAVFKNDTTYYLGEFNRVLRLFIFSCKKMILQEEFDLTEWETFLRNILVEKYLKKYKSDFKLDSLSFYSEVGEISTDYKTIRFVDIHVSNPMGIMGEEDIFFAFECKRLDGYSAKNKEYINNGLYRFINGKYARTMPLAGMVGFVQGFKKGSNMNSLVADIKNILDNHKIIRTKKNFIPYKIDGKFKHSYFSQHKRKNKLCNIDLYHLFFDFTITPTSDH